MQVCQRAIYPGTFDPVTYGHIDIIKRAQKVFPEIVVAVAANPGKSPLFGIEERVKLLSRTVAHFDGIAVEPFEGLVVDYARKKNIATLIRGVRMFSDFEYEFQMALTNRKLYPDIETIFFMPHESYSYISSRLLKEIVALGADISSFVPDFVQIALKNKLQGGCNRGSA